MSPWQYGIANTTCSRWIVLAWQFGSAGGILIGLPAENPCSGLQILSQQEQILVPVLTRPLDVISEDKYKASSEYSA